MLALVLICMAFATVVTGRGSPSYALAPARGQHSRQCTKQCDVGFQCELQTCQVCVAEPASCKTHKCKPIERCEDTPMGPRCVLKTCADIRCAAGFLCNDLPDGPDCVPDVPSCEGFYCRRGTNCYIRQGHPTCLPNTCEVRECDFGLTCIDTPAGALCRRGNKRKGCASGGKYCPENSKCVDTPSNGSVCVKI